MAPNEFALPQLSAERVRRLAPTRTELTVGLGLALYMAWVDCTFHGSQLITSAGFPELATNRTVYLVSIVTLCATLLACAVFHRKASELIFRPDAVKLAPVAMAVSTLLILGSTLGGAAGGAFAAVSGVATALSSAACLFHWGALCSSLNMREIVYTAVIGYVASDVFASGFQAVATMTFLPGSFVGVLLICLDAAFALAAGGVVVWAMGPGEVSPLASVVEPSAGLPANSDDEKLSRSIMRRLFVALVVLGFTLSTCRDLTFSIGGQTGYTGGMPWVFLQTSALVALGSLFICLAFLTGKPEKNVGACYRALVYVAALSVFAVSATPLYDNPDLSAVSTVSMGTVTCCHILMWITTAGICRRYRAHTTEYFAAARLGWAAGPLLGYAFCKLFANGGASPQLLYAHLFVCVAALLLVLGFVFTENTLAEALSLIPRKYRRPFKERCALAAKTYGLTERELEVMALFAKGRDSAYIQKELCLSKSTVSTHRQHIYGKMDVHSQQELLNKLFELENAG